jgi:zeaxanthin glucosyltransferase
MAHLLIVTRGLASLVYPAIELARRLAAAGHRVTFAGDETAGAVAAEHHLGFLRLDPDAYDTFLRADRRSWTAARWANRRARGAQARAALLPGAYAAALERDPPDLVLINGEMHEHIIATAAAGVEMALLNSFVSIWRAPGLPPPHHLARPGTGWRGSRIGMSLLWHNLRLRKLRKRWLAWVRDAGCDRETVLRDLAHAAGLESELDDRQWLIPFTYRRFPVLSLHAAEFEFPHRPPDHVHPVGPMILASRGDKDLATEDRRRLDELLASGRDGDPQRTLIYAGFGSVLSADLGFLRRLIQTVKDRPSWDLVLSLSRRIEPAALGSLPPRVHAFSWVPQMEVLSRADVVITHGGISTIDECVASGVPVVIYCGGETDMAGTTSRAVHHGLGVAGNRRDSVARIRGHVDRVLADPGCRSAVDRFRKIYAAYAEARVAERTVEALLSVRRSPARVPR